MRSNSGVSSSSEKTSPEIKKKGIRERASSDFFTKTTRPERPAFWRSKRSTSVIFAATSAEH